VLAGARSEAGGGVHLERAAEVRGPRDGDLIRELSPSASIA
jgi:hypothetical protein